MYKHLGKSAQVTSAHTYEPPYHKFNFTDKIFLAQFSKYV
jgi:hypothetical protein